MLRCAKKNPCLLAGTRHSMHSCSPLRQHKTHESEYCITQPSRSPCLLDLLEPDSPQYHSPDRSADVQWAALPLLQHPQAPIASCQEASRWLRPALKQLTMNDKDSLCGYMLSSQLVGAAA